MFPYSFIRRLFVTLCAGVFIVPTVTAGTIFDFDGVASGTEANLAIGSAASLVSFANAVYTLNADWETKQAAAAWLKWPCCSSATK